MFSALVTLIGVQGQQDWAFSDIRKLMMNSDLSYGLNRAVAGWLIKPQCGDRQQHAFRLSRNEVRNAVTMNSRPMAQRTSTRLGI